ncbi:MAG: polysaccharide deacetylase family protein [Bryobacteraceae bacterium]
MRALAIMYHDVVEDAAYDSSGFPGEGANIYKLRREDFARQLEAIRAAVPAGAVSLIPRRREIAGAPPVFLTFDDGGVSCHAPIAGMLEQLGWRGHFFITTSRIGTPGFLGEAQLRDLHRRGHVIGSHSHSHPTRMAALAPDRMESEWRQSLGRLADILGEPVKVASVPGGYYSRLVGRTAAAAGIEVLFNSEPTAAVCLTDGCLVLGRYVVKRGMGPEWAAGFAAGRLGPRWRQTALWKAKRVAKALGGAAYLKVRQAILDR